MPQRRDPQPGSVRAILFRAAGLGGSDQPPAAAGPGKPPGGDSSPSASGEPGSSFFQNGDSSGRALPAGSAAASSSPSLTDAADPRTADFVRAEITATPTYRPTLRPPTPVLRVYDDDQTGFETVRIRSSPFQIGRQDGDFVLGHERQMSRRHARIDRVERDGSWRWTLSDLGSTNGCFARVASAAITPLTDMLFGGELVRVVDQATGQAYRLESARQPGPSESLSLTDEHLLIGTDARRCAPFLRESPLLDPCSFRLERRGVDYRVTDLGSTNHLWIAIHGAYELTDGAMFQVGEQRFGFHLP